MNVLLVLMIKAVDVFCLPESHKDRILQDHGLLQSQIDHLLLSSHPSIHQMLTCLTVSLPNNPTGSYCLEPQTTEAQRGLHKLSKVTKLNGGRSGIHTQAQPGSPNPSA